MKKHLLATAVCALAVPAFAEPKLYGKVNASLQLADEGGDSVTELVSNASRIGIKGSVELEGGLKAIYQAEYETFVDDGEKAENEAFSQRNIFVGLTGDFGTVKAGHFDTAFKKAQKKIDLFNDLEGDIKNLVTRNDNRASNNVSYTTPKLGAFSGTVDYIASEDEDADDGVSAAVSFEQSGLYVAVAVDQNVEADDTDALRVVGQYNIGAFQLGAMFERYDDGFEDLDATFVSVQYKVNKWAFKGQFGQSDINIDGGETLSIGADYKLAKNFKLFGYVTQNEGDANPLTPTVPARDDDYLGFGAELKF